MRSIPDELKFPYAPKEKCTEKPSKTTTKFNFLNRALTHTKVSCTWDEPEVDNRRNEILFKDGFEDQIDIEDYLAPGIDEGVYDDDSDQQAADLDGGIQSAASSSEEEPEDKPKKKLVTSSGGNSTKENSVQEALVSKPKSSVFADFDKSKKKATQLKITFQNPLESKLLDDDNPLGKRVYSMKYARKHYHEEQERLEENAEDFFENQSQMSEERDEVPADKEEKSKLKFKERMKEKKKQAKLEKEKKRTEQRELREDRLGIKSKQTQDLELIAGDKTTEKSFRADYSDPRFRGAFEDHDMAIDTTSTMFNKNKHTGILYEKKKRRADTSSHN